MVCVASAKGVGNGLALVAGLSFFGLMPLLGDHFGGILLVGTVLCLGRKYFSFLPLDR